MNIQSASATSPPVRDPSHLGTGPIPAGPYYREDYFALERDAVFRRSWLQIGHVCELKKPGSFIVRPLEFARASILITRGRDGVIRAFHNVCTHRGTELVAEKSGARLLFTCPYHAWTFGNDGNLVSAPDFERFFIDKSQCSLPPLAVELCAGLIFVNLDPDPAQSLRDFLGPLAEQLESLPVAKATIFAEYTYEVDANWKLTYDNFQENYHLRFIHPRSGGMTFSAENPYGYPVRYGFHGVHRTQTIWTNTKATPTPTQALAFGKARRFIAEDGFADGPYSREYFAIFPNLFVLGSPSTHFSQTVYPISATRSRSVVRLYWIGDDDSASKRFVREYALATARDVHSEDRAVIEAGQRGLSSGALQYIHFMSQEVLCRHLFHSVSEMVEDYQRHRPAGGVSVPRQQDVAI